MRYLRYGLHGFEEITLTNNSEYYPVNNHLFKGIHLSDDVKQMTVELEDSITYDKYNTVPNNFCRQSLYSLKFLYIRY